MSQTVSELLVGVLEQIGVRHIFGLIGDSLNPLADAVRHSKIECVRLRHDERSALDTETFSPGGLARAATHRASAAAYAGPGVAHLTLPQAVISARAEGKASSLGPLKPRSEITASETDVAEGVRRIDASDNVVIM